MTAPEPVEESFARLVGTLAVAGLLSGVAIAGAYQLSLPRIEANQAEALRRAVVEVVPGTTTMVRLEWVDGALVPAPDGHGPAVYGAWASDGSALGYAVPGEGAGFQDTIKLLYGYDPQNKKIIGLQVLESRETPGLGDRIYSDPLFLADFKDLTPSPSVVLVKHGARSSPDQIDAITGATISSRAVITIVDATHKEWVDKLTPLGPPPEAH